MSPEEYYDMTALEYTVKIEWIGKKIYLCPQNSHLNRMMCFFKDYDISADSARTQLLKTEIVTII